MAEVHHFTYGVFNPIAAYLLAFLGSFLGLLCTGRARAARSPGRRNRWLVIAAFSIGGAAIWLMHFTAMLGFDVPASPVRYDVRLTVASLAIAVVFVGFGLLLVGHGRRSPGKTVIAGVITGSGVLAMHYSGMRAMQMPGDVHYRPTLVVASGIIAIVAATVALWFAQSVKGWAPITGAAAVMAVAVCGMHYTGMAAMQVDLGPLDRWGHGGGGVRPLVMIVPITLLTAATIVGMALSALQAIRIMRYYGIRDVDVIVAALLHDAVEDHPAELAGLSPTAGYAVLTDAAVAELARRFNPRVAELVRSVTNPEYDPDRDRDDQYRMHVAASLDRDPWARVIKVSDFTDNGVGVIHTTYEKAFRSATKYRPLVPKLRELVGRPDTPLSVEAKDHILDQLDLAEERFAAILDG